MCWLLAVQVGLRCVWELAKYKDAGGSLRTAIHRGGRRRCIFPPGALSYLVMFGKWTWDACRSCCNKCGYCRDEEWLFAPTVLLLLPLKRSELDFNRDPQSYPLSFCCCEPFYSVHSCCWYFPFRFFHAISHHFTATCAIHCCCAPRMQTLKCVNAIGQLWFKETENGRSILVGLSYAKREIEMEIFKLSW